jgi:hypothetical protein
MNPLVRIAFRALFVGIGIALGSVVANLPGLDQTDYIQAAYLGYTGAMSYVGLGTFTDLEPTLGVSGSPKKIT